MKYAIAFATAFCISFMACAAMAPTSPGIAADANDCGPPSEFGQGMLMGCNTEDMKSCCGFGFLVDSHQTVCFAILCQTESCGDWSYYQTICPEMEEAKPKVRPGKDASNYDSRFDEGWATDI
jgi:hypothetical protein